MIELSLPGGEADYEMHQLLIRRYRSGSSGKQNIAVRRYEIEQFATCHDRRERDFAYVSRPSFGRRTREAVR